MFTDIADRAQRVLTRIRVGCCGGLDYPRRLMSDPNAQPPAFAPDLIDAAFDDDTALTALPAVVAVVATAGAGSLDGCLRGLVAQQYPELTILVVNDEAIEGIPGRVAAIDPSILILNRLATCGTAGAASAYNELLGRVSGAPLLLLIRDDVALDPDAVRIMVEESFRSNAAIVGPKLVAADDLGLLVDVGSAIDHYGTAFSPLDPAERDQEQHDGVRDVFFVSDRAMLVRADIFEALGGFDLDCTDSVAIDLAWRARLAGARVLVAPNARGRVAREHARLHWPLAAPRSAIVGRIRACVKSNSAVGLAWSLPLSFMFTALESIAYLSRRRARDAATLLAGWVDALRSTSSLRVARRETQQLRVVDDAEFRVYMIRGNARIRTLLTQRLHVDDRIADASIKTREALDDATGRFRHAELGVLTLAIVVALLSTRGFVTGSVPNVGGFASWQKTSHLWDLFTSARRSANLGTDAAAPPMFGLAGAWSLLWLGHAALAQAMLVAIAGPFGVLATFRLLRRHSVNAWPPVAGAIVYGANPVLRNGIAQHQVAVVVAYATIPVIAALTFELVWHREQLLTRDAVVRRLAQLLSVLLVATSFAPILLALPVAVMLASFAASAMVGTEMTKVRGALLRVVGVSGAAFVALLPWSMNLLNGDGTTIGLAPRPALSLVKIMSFQTGPNGAGALAIVFWASALLPLFVAAPDALRFAVAGWLLALLGVGGVLVTQHLDATAPLPELGILLSISALGLALAVGIGVAAVVSELRTFMFGFRQIVVVVGVASILVPTLSWLGDVADGRVRAAQQDWASELSWMDSEAKVVGAFRVLWVGSPAAFPSPGVARRGVKFALTTGAGGDISELLAPTTGAISLVGESLQLARRGTTTRLGHLLAPMNVRYVAVVERATPDGSTVADTTGSIGALNGQLDFSVLNANDGIHLYRNLAWAPKTAVVGSENRIQLGVDAARDPIDAALRAELADAKKLKNPVAEGTVLLGESDSTRWSATIDGHVLDRFESFGWATAWRVPQAGTVHVRYSEPASRWLVVGFEILVFVAALLLSAGAKIPQRSRASLDPTPGPDADTENS